MSMSDWSSDVCSSDLIAGDIAPNQLFNAGLYDPATKSFDVQNWLRAEAYEDDHHHGHGHGHHHDHDHDHGHDHGHEHFTTEDGRIDVNRHDSSIQSFCQIGRAHV